MAVPLARRLARDVLTAKVPPGLADKLQFCLLDFLACAFEARDLPWSRQAAALAARGSGCASVIGQARRATAQDAAFANAVAGHGLVREDMHAGAVSHLGVVVLPALLALAQHTQISGSRFTEAAILGYEVGARLGRALVTPEFTRRFRPTGFTGPLAATAAAGRMLALGEDALASALSLAANTVSGLNQWPEDGGEDMYFHPGFAARNAVTVVELAALGAYGSAGALDGKAGLFTTFGASPAPDLALFVDGGGEILSVFNKPFPACNFAQSPCQAALELVHAYGIRAADIRSVRVAASEAAVSYPGCDRTGPFARALQAKMSIQFGVATALLNGVVEEASYAVLDDPELRRIIDATTLEIHDELTRAFPGRQGAEVTVTLQDGTMRRRMVADVIAASPEAITRRYRHAATQVVGQGEAGRIEDLVLRLPDLDDVARLARLTETRSTA